MRRIQDFIRQAAQDLDTSVDCSCAATRRIVQMIQSRMAADDRAQLLGSLPGVEQLLHWESGGFHVAVGAAGAQAATLGTGADPEESPCEPTDDPRRALFADSGLNPEQSDAFLWLFLNFVRQQADPILVGRLLDQVGGLRGRRAG